MLGLSSSVAFRFYQRTRLTAQIPALLGNIVGGVLMVGTVYWYLNLTGEPTVVVDGVAYQEPERLTGYSPGTTSPAHDAASREEKRSADDIV